MIDQTKPVPEPDLGSRIIHLKQELASVTRACEAATGEPGHLFFLLRKKWKLTQEIFQAESELLLLTRPANRHAQARPEV